MGQRIPPKKAEPIEKQLETVKRSSREQLRQHWREVYGSDPPDKMSVLLLRQALAYRLQVRQLGGLTFAARRALERALEQDSPSSKKTNSKTRPVSAGAVLIRQWRGATHQVTVLDDGVRYRDRHYRSLSEVAREITGTRWSGPLFFGLRSALEATANGRK